jgi:hypothetical protein
VRTAPPPYRKDDPEHNPEPNRNRNEKQMATVDPWADPDTGAAEDASEFLTNEELIGRNLLIIPKSIETIPGEGTWPDGRAKTDYERIVADIIVLDGRRNPKVKAFPHTERDKYVSSFKVVKELKKYVGTETPVLGYWTQVNKGYFLERFDSSDGAVEGKAREAWAQYVADTRNVVPAQSGKPPF